MPELKTLSGNDILEILSVFGFRVIEVSIKQRFCDSKNFPTGGYPITDNDFCRQ